LRKDKNFIKNSIKAVLATHVLFIPEKQKKLRMKDLDLNIKSV